MKKILYVLNSVDYFLAHRLSLARAVQKAGFEVHLATPQGSNIEVFAKESFYCHPIPYHRSWKNPWQEIKTLTSLYKLYRRLRPDLINHITVKPILYGSLASRLARANRVVNNVTGLGYIFTKSDWKTQLLSHVVKKGFRFSFGGIRSLRTIFENPDDRNFFLQENILRESQAILIRGAGVNPQEFPYTEPPTGTPAVLLGSRMLSDKGIREFVEAARLIRRGGVNARFLLAGDTDTENPRAISRSELKKWHEEGNVEWLGFVKDISRIIQQSAIVCLPSYREGLPRILLEAASCGRPLVTTDEPGCREVVINNYNGFLVPSRNIVALAEALKKLIADAPMRKEMGLRSRKMIEEEFCDEVVISKTIEVYGQLLHEA